MQFRDVGRKRSIDEAVATDRSIRPGDSAFDMFPVARRAQQVGLLISEHVGQPVSDVSANFYKLYVAAINARIA